MATNELPEYINRRGDPSLPMDFALTGSIYALRLGPKKETENSLKKDWYKNEVLQPLCDEWLNKPRGDVDEGERYIVLDNDFLICYSSVTSPPYPAYEEVYFAIRCNRRDNTDPVWFITDMFLSNKSDLSIATGREVFGFPKSRETFETESFPDGKLKNLEVKKLTEIKKTLFKISEDGDSTSNDGNDDNSNFYVDFSDFTAVTLKQFRDAENKNKACYQQVIETKLSTADFDSIDNSNSSCYSVWIEKFMANSPDSYDITERFKLSQISDVDGVGYKLKAKDYMIFESVKFTIKTGTVIR